MNAMKACELFQSLSPTLGTEIIRYLRSEHKDVYRATVATLAQQRKLRPQFVQKKTGEQQIAWILETLKLRSSEAVGEQLLQVWLMKAQSPMLIQFLEALEIPHDGNGGVDGEIPSDFEAARVEAAVSGLLEKFPAESVAVYLHIFQLQQPGGWPAIESVLAAEPRLALGAAPLAT
jgi:hypothetical protein